MLVNQLCSCTSFNLTFRGHQYPSVQNVTLNISCPDARELELRFVQRITHLGVSENSVPLKPMVNDHYPYEMAIIGIYPIFRQTHMHTMHSHRILISLSIPSPNGVPRPSCLALGALKLQHNPQVPSCQSPVHVPQLRGLCQIDSTLVAQKKTSRHSTKLSMVCIGVPIHYVIMCSTFRAV